jgi:hypothetical protein
MKHSLLRGRVDPEQDRIGRGNPNLMGAKHVAELVRTLAVGIEGRISRRLEDELREDALIQKTNEFLDALVAAFPRWTTSSTTRSPPTNCVGPACSARR